MVEKMSYGSVAIESFCNFYIFDFLLHMEIKIEIIKKVRYLNNQISKNCLIEKFIIY